MWGKPNEDVSEYSCPHWGWAVTQHLALGVEEAVLTLGARIAGAGQKDCLLLR